MDQTGEQPDNEAALVAADRREVTIDEGGTIVAVRVPSGDIYVPIRPVCDRLGVDPQAQTRRIRRDEVLAEGLRSVQVETEGGAQTLLCLEIEGVPLWLAGIEPSRVRVELRERLKTFKRWVRRRVYEAFVVETGIGELPGSAAIITPEGAEASPLDQIESFGLALAAFARQQRQFEARYTAEMETVHDRLDHLDTRLDRAAQAFGSLMREVQIRLDLSDVITDAQATEIKELVQAIAQEQSRRGGAENAYRSLWSEIYRRFRVPSYHQVKQAQFPMVMAWLQAQQAAFDVPPSSPGDRS